MVEEHAKENTELVLGNASQGLGRGQRVDLDWGVRYTEITVEALGVNEVPGRENMDKKNRGSKI